MKALLSALKGTSHEMLSRHVLVVDHKVPPEDIDAAAEKGYVVVVEGDKYPTYASVLLTMAGDLALLEIMK